jgi:hypothetical protein
MVVMYGVTNKKSRINVTVHPTGESKDQHILFKDSFSVGSFAAM